MPHPSHAPGQHGRPPETTSELGALLPRPTVEVDLPHGYTLTQVNAIAVWAARRCAWVHAMDIVQRCQTAWSAIIEHLYVSTDPPPTPELIKTGWAAMKAQHARDQQTHGISSYDRSTVSGHFTRYWTPPAPADVAEQVTERVAFWQIWAMLTCAQREAVRAVAEHPVRTDAAAALGISAQALNLRIVKARATFLAHWHQGETPSRLWSHTRSSANGRTVAQLMAARRRLKRIRDGLHTPSTDPAKRAGRDIGISNQGLLELHETGTTIAELAHTYRMSWSSIRDRVNKARPQPPPA